MNVHILRNAMVVQMQNDQKVVNRIHVKTQRQWIKLGIVAKQYSPFQNQFWSN
jgi:hypothetical protein